MATAHDVAKYILERIGAITAMKMQKLVYYSQAWSLVWDEEPMFEEEIQAWANGPVIVDLYASHRGKYMVENWPQGDVARLSSENMATIDAVLTAYGDLSSLDLSQLTHSEAPWIEARAGLAPGERGSKVITQDSMADFYMAQFQAMQQNN